MRGHRLYGSDTPQSSCNTVLSGRMRPLYWRWMAEVPRKGSSGIGEFGHADGPEIPPHLGPHFLPHLRRVRQTVRGQEFAYLEINLSIAVHIKPVADPCQTFLVHSLRSESYMASPKGIILYQSMGRGNRRRIAGPAPNWEARLPVFRQKPRGSL